MLKITRQIVSFMLMCVFVANCLPGFDAAAEFDDKNPILIYSNVDFEDQTIGDVPEGFYFRGGRNGFSVVEKTTDQNSKNKAVKLDYVTDSSPSLACTMYYAPVHNNFVLSFKFLCEDTNGTKRVLVRTDATQPRNTLYLDSYGTAFNIFSIQAGEAKFITQSSGEKPEINKWYDVDIEINMEEKTIDGYINGKNVASKVRLPDRAVKNIASIELFSPSEAGAWFIDDFKVYVKDNILPDEEYNEYLEMYNQSEIIPKTAFDQGRLYQYDKFVLLTLHNKFAACVNGIRFYKENRYYDLPIPIKEIDKIVFMPVKAFAESFGANVSYDEATHVTCVSYNGRTLEFTNDSDIYYINSKTAKMQKKAILTDGHLCVQIEVLAYFFGINYQKVDELLMFGEKLKCPYDLGIMETNQAGRTLEEEVFLRIKNSFLYERPSSSELLDAFHSFNPENYHPRVLINDFTQIKEAMKTDEDYNKLVNQIVAQADTYVDLEPASYYLADGLRADFPQQIYARGVSLSFAHKMTGEQKYKDALWANLEAASKFPDFNPNHFLDVGNTANGIAVAYDWLYDDWTESQRKTIEEMIVDKIFLPALKAFKSPLGSNETGFAYNVGNQPLIINAGISGCAIGMLDKMPELCSEILACSLRSVETCFGEFAPDGQWTEGVAYWQYTMGSLPYLVSNYIYGLGSDFGMLNSPGLSKTAYFPLGVSGGKTTFPMGDDAAISPYHSSFTWLAKMYNDKELARLRSKNLNGANIMDVLYKTFDTESDKQSSIALDNYFRVMETVSLRTGLNDSDTTVLLHGGKNNTNHGHIDIGTFQFDMLGERWACEVPKEDYNLMATGSYEYIKQPDYKFSSKDYYRYKAEGHNTVIANLGREPSDQELTANSKIVKFDSKNSGAYAILDMTPTNKLYSCAVRGVKLDKINNSIVVQDNFSAKSKTDFWWFMTTQADIELSADNKSVILSKNSKRVWVSIIDGDEVEFSVMDAAPMKGYYDIPPLQSPNEGYKKLAITKKQTDNLKLSVAFCPLHGDETVPSIIPDATPMVKWTFKDVDMSVLNSVTVDNIVLSEFDKNTKNYTIQVVTEKSPVPDIDVTADNNISVETVKATTVPGVTSVLLRENGQITSIYNFVISPINDTRKFLNDKQIPVISYTASSEPQAENIALNLFDCDLATKFATDEIGGSVVVDYGHVVNIDEVKMAFTNGDTRKDYFKLEVSTDGKTYKEVYNGGGNGKTKDYQNFAIGGVDARYLKVTFNGNSTGGSWVSIAELCSFTK